MFHWPVDAELSLRLLHLSDADEFYALADRNRDHLRRWIPEVAATTPDETRSYIAGTMERWARDEGFFCGIVCEGHLAGAMGIRKDVTNRCASIGYWLGSEFEGRGLVSRSVRAITDHLVRERGVERVEIRAEPENGRSRAVAERCGFLHEGTLRRAAWEHDRLVDSCVYAVIREEWLART